MSAIDVEAMAWIARQNGKAWSPVEAARLDAWRRQSDRHQGAYLRAQAIWELLNTASLVSDVHPVAPARPGPSRRSLLAAGAAAPIGAIGLGLGIVKIRTLRTTLGEFRKVPLPDRSLASLNSGSALQVDMGAKIRRVNLAEGEAWFEVAKNPDRPFIVEAGDVRVRAVGTAFSVRRKSNGAEVLVTEGVVEAWNERENGVRRSLTVGEAAFVPFEPAAFQVDRAPEEVARKLAWRDGNIVLNNETLAEAADDFNRYNAQRIIILDPSIASARLVGQYRLDQPEDFAESVHLLLDVPSFATTEAIYLGQRPAPAARSLDLK